MFAATGMAAAYPYPIIWKTPFRKIAHSVLWNACNVKNFTFVSISGISHLYPLAGKHMTLSELKVLQLLSEQPGKTQEKLCFD